MTPSNQHSDEAIAAYPDAPFTEMFGRHQSIIDQRTAFDRGRESKQHTDRETIAALIGAQERWTSTSSYVTTTDALIAADAILAAPSLSLVAERREFAETAVAHMRANGHGFTRRIDMELLYDALFASGILKPSSEVEAAALEAMSNELQFMRVARMNERSEEWWIGHDEAEQAVADRAARARSGKDE